MYRIISKKNGGVSFVVSGQMHSECVAELKILFGVEAEEKRIVVLDLRELTLVDEESVRFLESCETDGIELKNCPAYIREWIKRERDGS
jgi:hypothetical protein